MEHSVQVALAAALLAHIDEGTTDYGESVFHNPVENYTSPDRLHSELALFRNEPLFMGLSCLIPNPGDYFTEDDGAAPVLVARGEDAVVRAFLNVCRHRGSRVAEGCGASEGRFVCPYHGWTYDLSGNLAGIPDARSFPGVAPAEHGLVQLPCTEQDGMIWVSAAPAEDKTSINVHAHLAGLGSELAHYEPGRYHHYETRVMHQKMNWKLAIDTFLEPYHFSVLHRTTVGPIFVPNVCLFHPFGRHLRETLPRRSIESLKTEPEAEWDLVRHTAIVYVLFPNTVFVMQADHIETWRVYPVRNRVDEAKVILDFYIPEPAETEKARRHWDRNMDLTVRTVLEEDFPASEGMQRGFLSGAQNHLVFGRNEPALAYFERSVTEAVM